MNLFINHTYSSAANAKHQRVLSQLAVGVSRDGYAGRGAESFINDKS